MIEAVDVRSRRRIVLVLLFAAVIMIVYWTLWYAARNTVASNHKAAYTEFENAFPAADALITFFIAGAAIALRRHHPSALASKVPVSRG